MRLSAHSSVLLLGLQAGVFIGGGGATFGWLLGEWLCLLWALLLVLLLGFLEGALGGVSVA